ncbi:MAG: hypothetical protein U0793_02955 [Gemmataceae bacterium]
MAAIIHARLDPQTAALCRRLAKQFGWSDSKIVREAIRVLAALAPGTGPRKVIGQGKFRSGLADLGSNKRHLDDFGR